MLSLFIFAVMVYVELEMNCIKLGIYGALSELLHANDVVVMSGTIKGLWNKFSKRKEALYMKCLKVEI